MPDNQKMIDALLRFGHAYTELVDQIVKTDVELFENYPLQETFEEINFHKWVQASIDKLSEKPETITSDEEQEFNQEEILFV